MGVFPQVREAAQTTEELRHALAVFPQVREAAAKMALRWHNTQLLQSLPVHSRIRQPVQPCRGRFFFNQLVPPQGQAKVSAI